MNLQQVFNVAQAYASAAAEAEHHAPSINDIWFPLINFAIYAFVLIKYAFPVTREFLKSRRKDVIEKISQAAAKKQAAEALVNEYRARLAGLDKEIQSIHAGLLQEGEKEKTKLLIEARATAVKIREDASFLADQEVKMARQKMREELADEAEAAARRLVQRNLSAADQSRLVDQFIQTIGQAR